MEQRGKFEPRAVIVSFFRGKPGERTALPRLSSIVKPNATGKLKKGLIRGAKAKTLSGTVVQTFRNPQNIVVPNFPEVDPLFQASRPYFLAFFTAKVEFCLGSMKVYPDRLQSKHKRPTIWGTGHRGPFFVGHFINPGDIRAFCLSVSCSLTLPGQIVGQGAKLWSIFCIFPFGEICIFCLISASLSPYFFSLCQIGI